jgi:ATP-dependent Clp protease ATP-binding subunit ClpB
MTDINEEEVVEKTKGVVYELLKQSVRPEFLNRIDEVIMFKPLSRKDIGKIVELQINHIREMLSAQHIDLRVTPEAMRWLANEGYHPEFGARPLKRLIQKKVLRELSKQLLSGKVEQGSGIVLDVFDDVVVFRKALANEPQMV